MSYRKYLMTDDVPPSELYKTVKIDTDSDTISRQAIDKFIDGLEEIFAHIRDRYVDDSVCGLCEYDGAYIGQSGDWCNECPGFDRDDCFKLSDKTRKEWVEEIIKALTPIQPAQLGTNLADVGTDCISRQAAIEGKICIRRSNGVEIYDDYVVPVEYLEQLPPAQPEPSRVAKDISRIVENGQDMRVIGQERIKGHWVDDCTYMGIQCSVCGKSLQDYIHATEYAELMEVPNFCPNCGADMREVTE